jgi:ribosomal-protein-alanine N-acetyltransferase
MEDDEVEEIIDLEYEILGLSVFVDISTKPYHKKVFVAESDGEIVGAAVVFWNDEFRLGSIVVKEEFRRQGIGKALIKRSIEFAKEKNFNSVWLEVSVEQSNLVSYYKSLGFRIHDVIKHFYGIGKHAYSMVYRMG